MKRSLLTAVLSALFVTGSLLISGTAVYAEAEETADAEYIYEEYDEEYEEEEGDEAEEIVNPDQEAADQAAALIDAICAEEWTEETDALVGEARAAWEALTDLQKEMVAGEAADPDYFGLDTGDASLDDPLNADDIGEKEILVVSCGTAFNESRAADIGAVEKALAAAFPEWSVRRAFAEQPVINHVAARDEEQIDNIDQALARAVSNGVKHLVVQPTFLMQGEAYDELCAAVRTYQDRFETMAIAKPLLGDAGDSAETADTDMETAAKAVVKAACEEAGYEDLEAAEKDRMAFVFVGHGASDAANDICSRIGTQMKELGYANVFIGTVEGTPEDMACQAVIDRISEEGYTKVTLRPLMVAAGESAHDTMADPNDEASWLSRFEEAQAFSSIDVQMEGLGRLPGVEELYAAHTAAAISEEP